MRTYKESIKMLKRNFSSIILFEITFRLLSSAILVPFLYFLFNLSVSFADISYLTTNTTKKYLTSPATYVFFFLVLVAIAMYILINISGLIYAMEASHREEKVNSVVLLLKGVANALRIVNPKNIKIMVYVLFVWPLTYPVMISGSVAGFQMPEFLASYIKQNRFAVNVALVIYFILAFLSITRIFSMNFYTLYKVDFKEATRRSKETIKSNFFRILLGLILWNLAINVVLFLLQGTLATLVSGVLKKLVTTKAFKFVFEVIVQTIFLGLYLVFSIVATPLIYSYICTRFYQIEGDEGYEEFQEVKAKRKKRKKKELTEQQQKLKDRVAFCSFIVGTLILNGMYIYLAVTHRAQLNILYSTKAEVIAHRGDSENAPENTMAAIALAVENQADMIEIDVRQTADGEFILMHDESLYRTTGVKKKVGEVDYAYICTLDAGSHFSEEYAGEHIPTLEEVLQYGKENDIFFNIELKTANTDTDYAQRICDIIVAYEYEDNCIVSSMDNEVLKQVKEVNEDIQTFIILSLVVGKMENLEHIDGYSIKYTYVTASVVKEIHKQGKTVYAWTVNSEDKIKKLLLTDVDSIITDNPYNTKEIIYNANSNIVTDWIQRLIDEY